MRRAKTPTFVVELPLKTTAADNSALAKHFEAARQVYNACLGEALRALKRARESRAWQRARAMPKGKPKSKERAARGKAFRTAAEAAGFEEWQIQALATVHKNNAFAEHLGAHETQVLGVRAFKAVAEYAYGKYGKPRFKGQRGLHSIEGKANCCVRFKDTAVLWRKLELPALIDSKDEWLTEALKARTKYCRILRRTISGRERWFVQLVKEGHSPVKENLPGYREKHPQKRRRQSGIVGLDIGPSTVAIVGERDAKLERFCNTIKQPWRETRRMQRAMDRSRRATNPNNYNPNGTVKKGPKTWVRSSRYRKIAIRRAEAERRLAGERKRAHGELANFVLELGSTIKTEKLNYCSFQKNYGKSVKVRAPGMFVSMLRRKAVSAGGEVQEFPTRTTRLSQSCHGCGSHVKKPLSLRVHECACGIGPVQRDLYSAFLARFVDQDRLDARQAQKAWPDVEPLLRRAASSVSQSARGRALAATQVPSASEQIARQNLGEETSRPRKSYRRASVREGCGEVPLVPKTPGL